MDEALLADYLRLYHSPEMGPSLLARLLRKFGSLKRIQKLAKQPGSETEIESKYLLTLRHLFGNKVDAETSEKISKDMDWRHSPGHHIVSYESPMYPALLREIYGAPSLLYVVGNPAALTRAMLAIVGSRKATAYGTRNAYWMARELGSVGLGTCSGLARGIDSKSHRGALDSGTVTVAVMASGADIVYPTENRKLAEEIIENGALVTEFPLGTNPLPAYFPQRNRIISGLSLGTLVVEATEKSGSLITARYSLEQNREVFAIPGAVGTVQSKGCHRLIKQGAKLVEQPEDILEEFGIEQLKQKDTEHCTSVPPANNLPKTLQLYKGQYKLVLEAMEPQGSLLDGLALETGLEYSALIEQLLELELLGKIKNKQGRYFRVDC